jgi:Protein of unknown function (DUF2726)
MSKNKGCLFFLIDIILKGSKKNEEISYPYKRKKLLSNAELSFYHCLLQAIPEEDIVMCKCRMEDIMFVPRGTENHMKYRGYIKSRHVDFVICDKKTMYTKLVIELDDRSHKKTSESDKRKNEILKSVNIPIVRIPAQKTYNIEDVKKKITFNIIS